MSDEQKAWKILIHRIKVGGAGTYGGKHFMCQKHEHWKYLWAAERIAELEQQLTELRTLAKAVVDARDNVNIVKSVPLRVGAAIDVLAKRLEETK